MQKIGTINELTGEGYEILIDKPTRSIVLAIFINGKLLRKQPVDDESDTIILEEAA